MTEKNTINEAMKGLNKLYGTGSVARLDKTDIKIEVIPTGIPALDYVFACGGLPRGRIIEIFGEPGAGKTTLALHLAAQVQKMDKKVLWIDVERSFDSDYAQKIGVKTADLYVSQPKTGEEALDSVEKMAKTSQIDLIVLDSVAALVPKKELDGNIADEQMALTARLLSKSMRMLAGIVSDSKTVVVFLNQVRERVGVFWGKKEVSTGGKALKFYSSIRLEIKKGKSILRGTEIIGNKVSFCAVKNKTGLPLRVGEMDIIFGQGIK